MRLGLVVLPDEEASRAFVRCSEALVAGRSPRVTLGPGRLPHVSILHVETDGDPAAAWAEASRALPERYTLDVMALGLLPYTTPYNAPPAPPATMAYLMVPCSPLLRAAEVAALGQSWVRAATVTTGNGPRFQPHLTAAIWDGDPRPATSVLPAEVVARRGFSARLALGVIGANGTYERTLFGG